MSGLDRPLRVGIDARLPPGSWGGVEQVVTGLASGLAALMDGDEQYLFLAADGADRWLTTHLGSNATLVPTGRPAGAPPWLHRLAAKLPRAVRVYESIPFVLGLTGRIPRPEAALAHTPVDVMHFPVQTAFATPVPSIYHPHDLQHRHLPQYFPRRTYTRRESLYQRHCRDAAMVAVANSWTRVDVERAYGLPDGKVQVVPLAPPTATYPNPAPADLDACQARLGLPEAFALYPAQTWPHKNHLGLLDAIARHRDRTGVAIPVVCSGRTNEFFPQIQARMAELRLDGAVRFVGHVSPMELQCLYRLARLVVIPTLFEAGSFPLWEAFLAGTPAACSNVTSLPAQAGDAALVFDPRSPEAIAAAVAKLWDDADQRRILVERGRASVARFTWERTARLFRAHYRRLAGRPLGAPDRALLDAAPLI